MEDSFSTPEKKHTIEDDKMLAPWLKTAAQRPIFFYKDPPKINRQGTAGFLERNMVKWWQKGTSGLHRDYFKYTDRKKRALWVRADEQENWLVHGIFG